MECFFNKKITKYKREVRKVAQNKNVLGKLLSAALEGSANAIFFVNIEGKIVACNPAFERLMSSPAEEIVGRKCCRILHENEGHKKDCAIARIRATRKAEIITIQKGEKFFDIFLDPMASDGEFIGVAHTMVDVTERVRLEEALRESEEKSRTIMGHMPSVAFQGYVDYSLDPEDPLGNKVELLTGYPVEDFLSRRIIWTDLMIEEDIPQAKAVFVAALKNESDHSYMREYRIRKKSGVIIWIRERAKIVLDGNGRVSHVDGIFHDITDRKLLQEDLQNAALRDSLTGLYNRRFLEEALAKELSRARRSNRPVGVAMFDLDHFKSFNDRFGHDGGDALLRAFGQILQNSVREGDIACRYGGEEFVLVFPETGCEQVRQIAEKICQKLSSLTVYNKGQKLDQATVSAGVAVFPKHGEIMEDVLRAADQALYRAKAEGRNRVVVAQ